MKFSVCLSTGFEGVMYPIPFAGPEDFIAAVSESGPEGEYVRTQTDAYAADYTIRRDAQDFEAARLVLSLRDGKVTAFMLVWNIPETPEPPSERVPSTKASRSERAAATASI